jgi:hypothetical protein
MLIVLDNVLDDSRRSAVVDFFSSGAQARSMKWHQWTLADAQVDPSPMAVLVQHAAKFFDLASMVGCEYWSHYGTRPQWHVDKDEELKSATGEIACPLCSIVYYADVDAVGGAFMTETVSIKPVTNRMIVFSPGILHGVEEYTGTRMSVAVNPWSKAPTGYATPQTSEAAT